jgi:hypothetical protein
MPRASNAAAAVAAAAAAKTATRGGLSSTERPRPLEDERGPGDDERPVLPDSFVLEALEQVGCSPETQLSPEERRHLDDEGWLCLGKVLTGAQCDEMRLRLDTQLALEGETAGTEVHQQEGSQRLSNLNNKPGLNHDGLFDIPLTHPRVLAAMRHVLGDCIAISSLNFRQALPGDGHQAFHTDWGENPDALLEPPQFSVCNSLWMIDEFTEENGSTRVLPRSHLTGATAPDTLDDPLAPHPDEVLCLGEKGTVTVFNSHLFHGGTKNRTAGTRKALHGYFTRRHLSQQLPQQRHIERWNYDRMAQSDAGRAAIAILDVTRPLAAADGDEQQQQQQQQQQQPRL